MATESDTVTPENPADQTSPEGDSAYKGLQRVVTGKDREIDRLKQERAELASQLQSVQSKAGDQPVSSETKTLIRNLGRKLADAYADEAPETGAALISGIEAWITRQENSALEAEVEGYRSEKEVARAERESLDELRELARSLGADPDSPMIDYGTPGSPILSRLAKVRESALEAVSEAEPVEGSKGSANETHSVQPGAVSTPTEEKTPGSARSAVRGFLGKRRQLRGTEYNDILSAIEEEERALGFEFRDQQ